MYICIPHPHANGGFWDPSLWVEELGWGLTLVPSEADTSSDTVLLVHESWLLTEVWTEVCMEACGVILVTTVNERWGVHGLVSTWKHQWCWCLSAVQCVLLHTYTWIVQNTLTRLYSLPHALHTKIWACACARGIIHILYFSPLRGYAKNFDLWSNYTRSQSSGHWFSGYPLALASSSAIVISYSCTIN